MNLLTWYRDRQTRLAAEAKAREEAEKVERAARKKADYEKSLAKLTSAKVKLAPLGYLWSEPVGSGDCWASAYARDPQTGALYDLIASPTGWTFTRQ